MSTTRKALFTLAALGLTAFAAHPVAAQSTITGLFDTGVDAVGVSQANGTIGDQHYTLTSVPAGDTITQTLIRTSAGGFPIPPYIGDSTTSAWIGPDSQNDLSGPAGLYTYTTTFQVVGIALGTTGSAVIAGNWATDDLGQDILINGVSTGLKNTVGFTAYSPFKFTATNLTNGTNKLSFVVNNVPGNADNPTGLRVDGITASAAPEPSQIGMLALVAVGLGALVVKTRKRSAAAQSA